VVCGVHKPATPSPPPRVVLPFGLVKRLYGSTERSELVDAPGWGLGVRHVLILLGPLPADSVSKLRGARKRLVPLYCKARSSRHERRSRPVDRLQLLNSHALEESQTKNLMGSPFPKNLYDAYSKTRHRVLIGSSSLWGIQ
jgi:hypothetical protein